MFPSNFCIYFLRIYYSDIKTLVSFSSVNSFSWKFARMCRKMSLLKIKHWQFPYDLWTYGNQGQVKYCLCVCPCMTTFQLVRTWKSQLVWSLTLRRLTVFGDFRKKKRLNALGFAWEFLWSGMLCRPGKRLKRRGKSSSLHSKKNFLLGGCEFFVSDVISGGLLGHLGPLFLALSTNC